MTIKWYPTTSLTGAIVADVLMTICVIATYTLYCHGYIALAAVAFAMGIGIHTTSIVIHKRQWW
jgi:Kef-type K+ transport system membrane component KefB